MSFADQLRSFYVSEQQGANSTYNTNVIIAGVYTTVKRECTRQASGYVSANNTPPNINWRGAWNILTTYVYGDGVTDLGVTYVMILPSLPVTGVQPPNALYWDVYTSPTRSFVLDVAATVSAVAAVTAISTPEQGSGLILWKGTWNAFTTYGINPETGASDAVTYQGVSYVATQGSGPLPPIVPLPPPMSAAWYVPLPSDPIYPYVPQTGTYVATSQDIQIIRAELIKKLTATENALTVTPSGPINLAISW
jgi:hypothetical protein